ncbi:hemerythrin domain-containing protein [Streptomyces cellulosae]|uniref:hemerythrin domain-containing protein n=1 Tax=Streptomyces cellulosae TaxID=1968 RepID=UPI0004C83501|nr:hemerythrin domain-containing protein [Streptomyces cellulosae]
MPTIADQTVEQLGGRDSVLARQRRDHVEMDRLMNEYQVLADGEDRERVLKETVQLVFSHAFAEETVLWPVVRRSVAEGQELTARVEDEHQQINDLVADVERLGPADPEREEKVRRVFALIRQDIRDEEDLLLPRLQDTLGAVQLRRLGAAWEAVRRTAPTHPHPVVPRQPPGNAVLGVPLSLFDRTRDALGPGSPTTTAKKVLTALAGMLVAAAGAVALLRRRH